MKLKNMEKGKRTKIESNQRNKKNAPVKQYGKNSKSARGAPNKSQGSRRGGKR